MKSAANAVPHEFEKKRERLRRRCNDLHFKDGRNKREIRELLGVSRDFVTTWTKERDQDVLVDGRGWKKGRRRSVAEETVELVKKIHDELEADPQEYFSGPNAVRSAWELRHGDAAPPLRTIGQILQDTGRTKPRRARRRRGGAAYLCYPEASLNSELGRLVEADFIGPRYLKGRGKPIHFLGFSSKSPPKFRHYRRIQSQTGAELLAGADALFERFGRPDALKMDNAAAGLGTTSGVRCISSAMFHLFERQVVPVFSVPRKPFSQASIEGNNSVFARFFWNRREFADTREIDRCLIDFNESSLRLAAYQKPPAGTGARFELKVIFLRQVLDQTQGREAGAIQLLNTKIPIRKEYINLFVWAEWRLQDEKLLVQVQRDEALETIKEINFPIHPKSRKRLLKID